MSIFLSEFSLGRQGPDAPTIAIKDTIDIAGYRTTAASRALADTPPATRNAEVVERLLAAGWRIVGKTNMHELAFGMTGINDYTGTPLNPQDPERIPGGSSSGSAAAVGFGLADAALGTDTGGSVRGPAACCGVIGLKPTFARVSRAGVAPRETTLDCVGPFAREMRYIVEVMAAIDPGFDAARARDASGLWRVGVPRVECDAEIEAACAAALAATGCQSQQVELPGLAAAFDAGLTVINAETWAAFGHLTGRSQLGADLEARLSMAGRTEAAQLAHAEAVRASFSAAVDRALEDVDVLALPTLPSLPITLAQARAGVSVIAVSALIRPFNLSGHPALSFPVPLVKGSRTSGGGTDGAYRAPLRAGLQLIGRKGEDERVCAFALAVEAALARQS